MKHLFSAAIALSLLSAPAMAAPYDNQQGHGSQQNEKNSHDDHDRNNGRHDAQSNQSRHQYSYEGKHYDSRKGPEWHAPRGHNSHAVWSRGDRLPKAYRDRDYVIDYRAYHLKKPPHGYQWVRVNNDVFLVATSSGLISSIVINLFY